MFDFVHVAAFFKFFTYVVVLLCLLLLLVLYAQSEFVLFVVVAISNVHIAAIIAWLVTAAVETYYCCCGLLFHFGAVYCGVLISFNFIINYCMESIRNVTKFAVLFNCCCCSH